MNTAPQPPPTNNKRCLSFSALFAPFIIPLLLVLPLALSSCADEEEEEPHHFVPLPKEPVICDTCLPPITTGGKNTFGCRINGKVWKPKGDWFKPAVRADFDATLKLSIIANNEDYRETIGFTIGSIESECSVNFPTNEFRSGASFITSSNLANKYIAEPILNGKVTYLKVDYITGIFSGQFSFDLYNSNGDTMRITDGRFDVKK